MTSKKNIPFFTELGVLLNLIRSISSALNEDLIETIANKSGLGNIRYINNTPADRLQANLKKLESEVAFFFTDNGARKTTDTNFNPNIIRQIFIPAFKILCDEYFNIKAARKNKVALRDKTDVTFKGEVYKLTTQHPSVVN